MVGRRATPALIRTYRPVGSHFGSDGCVACGIAVRAAAIDDNDKAAATASVKAPLKARVSGMRIARYIGASARKSATAMLSGLRSPDLFAGSASHTC